MSRRLDNHVSTTPLGAEKTELVLTELDRVLASNLFKASRRCQSLLRRITELSLAGDVEALKERALGIEVFGRPPDYDTSQDPVVRATAGEIRKKLAQYYVEAGHELETRIELPSGAYLADFRFVAAPVAVEVVAPAETPRESGIKEVAAPARVPFYRRTAIRLWAMATLVVAAAGVFTVLSWPRSAVEELWAPLLKSPGQVLVCIGLQAAYNFKSAQAQDEVQGIVKQLPAGSPPRVIRAGDLLLLRDRYVAIDDALCLTRMTTLLERYGKPYRIRAELSTSFADLRDTPAVLIGAFDNPWALRAAGQLRFTFTKDSQNDVGMVHDKQHPENTQWKLANYWPEWDIPLDYAIVTRMSDSTTDRPVIIVAGLTQYGTIGAGEFITKAEYFAEAAKVLKKGWQKKNLQIVLSVPVVNRISGRPRILDTHSW
ncbi:MAG: hypothetical protein ABI759_04755 [Candidatus Solibacter sp.]